MADLFESICAFDVAAVRAALAADPGLVEARDPNLGSTPLVFAAHRGEREIVRALLDAGADVRARERASDSTPLHWAGEAGHAEIAGWLLDRGAELEARDGWFDLTPLGWASGVVDWAPPFREDRPATVTLLRARGAAADAFVAVGLGSHELLDGVDLERRLGFVGEGKTALHVAVELGRTAMVRSLLARGADVWARTDFGLTPLAIARDRGDDAIAGLLRRDGAADDASTALFVGGEISASPELATQLLRFAARRGLRDAAATLLDLGADPAAKVRWLDGERPTEVTPLQLAEQNEHDSVVELLRARGIQRS